MTGGECSTPWGGYSPPDGWELGYYSIRLTSGGYASYWNTFLSLNIYCFAFVASAYRWDEKEVTLPRIPGHPIGYADAEQLLRYQ